MERKLIVEKTTEYVWRVHSLGMGENHGNIPVWWVKDAESDEVVAGGFSRGNNCTSGSSYIRRRKDAKAYIEGYMAALADPSIVGFHGNGHYGHLVGTNPHGYGRDENNRLTARPKTSDEDTENHYATGAVDAAMWLRKQAA